MNSFSHEASALDQGLPPTAPILMLSTQSLPEVPAIGETELGQRASSLGEQWEMLPADEEPSSLQQRLARLQARLEDSLERCSVEAIQGIASPQLELLESTRMLEAALPKAAEIRQTFADLPLVRVGPVERLPRVIHLAEMYLAATKGIWSGSSLTVFVDAAQASNPLLLNEVSVLPVALKMAQLEFILDRVDEAYALGVLPSIERSPFSAGLHSMRRLGQAEWPNILEPLVAFEAILRKDPSRAYPAMEDEGRSAYRLRIATLARRSDCNELETARAALELSEAALQSATADPRWALRSTHVGFYLFAEGLPLLWQRIGFHPPPMERVRTFLRKWNEEYYILGIFSLSLLLIVAIIAPLVPHHTFWAVIGALLLALLPATQGAVDLVNGSVTALFHAESLPKLDFSLGVPASEAGVVAVPTLLLGERQVQELFDDLETRYLANQDPHLHYLLLTDLPDSKVKPIAENQHPLVRLAVERTQELNARYAGEKGGSFLLLHRHRIFNARQGVWMGWERKRGKLLDLNKLLLHEFDSFPIKAGPISALEGVRYVITLDSDTQLPRGSAARMIGTMAHPLNQAIINPRTRVVTAGYGILQPRVGVSVSSASVSRLSSLYSGETGFDLYTRATSDVYQDLFGEGSFAGKGIYEVSVLHQVLDRRFPRNALLSHDLIEGSYARAGLVTDIEVIDDYPSHYSAHTRRKHRWVRGDWQIARWIFNRVPDESGLLVNNPINTVSRWKIFDNLRRSLVEPVTFLMLVLGWLGLPGGPRYWTVATLLLLLLPVMVQFAFNAGRALLRGSVTAVRDSIGTLGGSLGFALLNLTFLPHQMLLSLDAIARSLSRSLLSGRHMLEWETAAQAETGRSHTPVDLYLRLSPALVTILVVLLWSTRARALWPAAPVLFLWAVAPLVVRWLNTSPRREIGPLSTNDRALLERQAFLIWRYFHEFGGRDNHWLIPDNVEERDTLQIRKLSPTNLGMLFNSRQAAYELGLLTLPEFVNASTETLSTYDRLEKHRGHIYNWYDIESLRAIIPFTVSAVDSGNLAASLYTLHAGALDLLNRPVIEEALFQGTLRVRASINSTLPPESSSKELPQQIRSLLHRVDRESFASTQQTGRGETNQDWMSKETDRRERALVEFLESYVPWLLPKFEAVMAVLSPQGTGERIPSLLQSAQFANVLEQRLSQQNWDGWTDSPSPAAAEELQTRLRDAASRLATLAARMSAIAVDAERYADAMEFGFLLVPSRQLLSIGYDGETGEIYSACYDLLASEARIAAFLAIAKGDIPQKAWFKLDRTHVLVRGRASLLSWTGTMFEYMMPALWMRHTPETLIGRSLEAAVRIQRDHERGRPWGISESGLATQDEQGRYGYQAFGIPALASKYGAQDGPVISPYSTYLAMPLLRRDAIANLRAMIAKGWLGDYGLYEAADYTKRGEPRLVRSWMAHHQGMSLLAITNLLHENVFQRWFHANPRVRAAELLLQEKPLTKETLQALAKVPPRAIPARNSEEPAHA